ncbi:DUF6879 family protein [Nonomuraea longicatena]|uniref:DUF6879 domain-containing protein n=1 Tax=Nonomuraea longicatena TaxID=83682 RepID=A0ABN1PXT6_9ACTN
MLLDGDAWQSLFDSFKHDAFRLETQPTYTMPAEAERIARFRRGEPRPADHNAAWRKRVAGYVRAGRTIGRVRVIRHPLTEYQQYQFAWSIPGNIEAGEHIRVLDITDRDLGIPLDRDWWMLDGSAVVHLNFRSDGTQINRELIETDVEPYHEWKRIAMEAAIPFEQYLKEHR